MPIEFHIKTLACYSDNVLMPNSVDTQYQQQFVFIAYMKQSICCSLRYRSINPAHAISFKYRINFQHDDTTIKTLNLNTLLTRYGNLVDVTNEIPTLSYLVQYWMIPKGLHPTNFIVESLLN